jgi:hypothetical protein
LQSNAQAHDNSAFGAEALLDNTSAVDDTAAGAGALRANTTGSDNTATGTFALLHNTTGDTNTAVGSSALRANTVGGHNTAVGYDALLANTSGEENTALGQSALGENTTGAQNSATGFIALAGNTTGNHNTADGEQALQSNTDGNDNTAVGATALFSNSSGHDNTAVGDNALGFTQTGSNNIGIGSGAGSALGAADHDDIMIGHPGVAGDSGVIAIGKSSNQSKIYVAGIRGVTTDDNNAVGVVVASNNQLGTISSSRRFKEDVDDMGAATDKLYQLRPVTFRYKKYVKEALEQGENPEDLPLDYGLIAEEVAKVYPDLVVFDKEGRPETIKYRYLAPMLLNELQKEHRRAEAERAQIEALQRELRTQDQRLSLLERGRSLAGALRERGDASPPKACRATK